MDLSKAIQELYEEKQKLERVIASLEDLQSTMTVSTPIQAPRRAGRKSMNPKERLEVSQRMKNYWAKRRRTQG